jgi:hypothetical protein
MDEFVIPPIGPGTKPPTPVSLPPRAGDSDLRPSLRLLRKDIGKTACDFKKDCPPNYTASIILAEVYAGENHQDGRTVLALREFFRQVKTLYKNLRGVLLVGAFPDALLRRRWGEGSSIQESILAYRSDIVLADLNGRWENCYHQEKGKDYFLVDDTKVFYKGGLVRKKVGQKYYNTWDQEIGDMDLFGESWDPALGKQRVSGLLFHVPLADASRVLDEGGNQVDKADVIENEGKYYDPGGVEYKKLYAEYPDESMVLNEYGITNLENPIAFPDILVSRINARNVARSYGVLNFPGNLLLDPYLERELLIAYFKRNHLYRLGEFKSRAMAGIACNHPNEDEYQPVDLRAAFKECTAAYKEIENEPSIDFWRVRNCSTYDFAHFLDQPAVLFSMLLHGDSTSLEFHDGKWGFKNWRQRWDQRDPSNKRAVFYWNTACHSNTPSHSDRKPYNGHMYGISMPAECLLFYGDGLAVFAQAEDTGSWPGKFPDPQQQPSPPGGSFERTLRARRTFGETWRATYEETRGNDTLNQTGESSEKTDAVRKANYIWGIVGDWTLKLN